MVAPLALLGLSALGAGGLSLLDRRRQEKEQDALLGGLGGLLRGSQQQPSSQMNVGAGLPAGGLQTVDIPSSTRIAGMLDETPQAQLPAPAPAMGGGMGGGMGAGMGGRDIRPLIEALVRSGRESEAIALVTSEVARRQPQTEIKWDNEGNAFQVTTVNGRSQIKQLPIQGQDPNRNFEPTWMQIPNTDEVKYAETPEQYENLRRQGFGPISGGTLPGAQEPILAFGLDASGIESVADEQRGYISKAIQSSLSADQKLATVKVGLDRESGIGDLALINQFQKIIDEGAVVRDSDVKLMRDAGKFMDSLLAATKGRTEGYILEPELRQEIGETATEIVEAIKRLQNNTIKYHLDIGENYNIARDRLVPSWYELEKEELGEDPLPPTGNPNEIIMERNAQGQLVPSPGSQ